jgi:hypothetical protein
LKANHQPQRKEKEARRKKPDGGQIHHRADQGGIHAQGAQVTRAIHTKLDEEGYQQEQLPLFFGQRSEPGGE